MGEDGRVVRASSRARFKQARCSAGRIRQAGDKHTVDEDNGEAR